MGASKSAHAIVLGNEKGGSGKSTTAVHIIVALLKSGFRVASIDTDSRQQSLTRYLENRAAWAKRNGLELEQPAHFVVTRAEGDVRRDAEAREFDAYVEIIDHVERGFDYVVVDTPGSDSYKMRLSHAMADTLVTPLNDSFIDLDVLGRVDPETYEVTGTSHYANLVRTALNERRLVDGRATDWVVVRNRVSTLFSRNQRNVIRGLDALSASLGFRIADGISERVIFREFFPRGLTAFDQLDGKTFGREPSLSHVAARREIRDLIEGLRLPEREDQADSVRPAPAEMAAGLPATQ